VGVCKRAAAYIPPAEHELLEEFKNFVSSVILPEFSPLASDVDLSVEHWLEQTHYPHWRKEELRAVHEQYPHFEEWMADCKCFMKDEVYTEWKFARGIYSRTDAYKCLVGPIFKAIEKEVFKSDWFIKKVPVAERPAFILERLGRERGCYYVTDYTSFESHFTPQLMKIEFMLYQYMLQRLSCKEWFMKLVRKVQGGTNKCSFKKFVFTILATRMSGEMCTSLGNSFFNMCVTRFLAFKMGLKSFTGVFEGDDGLWTGIGKVDQSLFEKLGLRLKMEKHEHLSHASFCGLVFDEEDLAIITDPRVELCTMGWCKMQYSGAKESKLRSLLRCKALSMLYQYAGCPILQPLAIWVLKMTRSHDVRHLIKESKYFNDYERDLYIKAELEWKSGALVERRIGTRSRALVAELYGIPVPLQISIEEYINGLSKIQPLRIPGAEVLFPQVWRDYFSQYSFMLGCRDLCSIPPGPSPLAPELSERIPSWLFND